MWVPLSVTNLFSFFPLLFSSPFRLCQRLDGVHEVPKPEAALELAVDGNHGHAALGGKGAHLLDGAGLGDDHPRRGRGRLAVDLVREDTSGSCSK